MQKNRREREKEGGVGYGLTFLVQILKCVLVEIKRLEGPTNLRRKNILIQNVL